MEVPSIFLNRVLVEAAKKNAAYLHLTVGNPPIMRIDNQLVAMEGESIIAGETLNKIMESFMSKDEMVEFKENKEAVLVKDLGGNFRFRINVFYQKNMPAMSIHHIPGVIKSLSDLGLPPAAQNFTNFNSGLLLIAGSHGSGKTTTAASFIEEVNKTSGKRVITLEDPIENLFVGKKSIIEQRQIGRDVKSVADGLNYCLMEDVDMVYLGEIRQELPIAMPLILELSAGNCLVILEMNVDSSIKAIEKIVNSVSTEFITEAFRYNLADALMGIIVQKLLPKHGGGMVLAAELLLANSAVKSLIREGKVYQLESIMQTSRREGMISMEKSIEELIKSGEVNQQAISESREI